MHVIVTLEIAIFFKIMMKSLFRIVLLAITAVAATGTTSLAFRIHASADTIRLSCGVGQLATYNLYVTDGRDSTNQPDTPLTYAHAWFSGTGDFRFGSDSLLSFHGSEKLVVLYSASSSTISNQVLNIQEYQGDTSTIHVVLIGTPPDHQNLWIGGQQDFDSLATGIETCDSMTLYNPNSFNVTVTHLWIASMGTYCRLSNVPATPFTLLPKQKIGFSACITGSDIPDTSLLGGVISAAFTYGTKSDTAFYPIYGQLLFIDSTCLTFMTSSPSQVPDGSTATFEVVPTNPTNGIITIDSASIDVGDTAQFQIDNSQFPLSVYPRSNAIFRYRFTAPNNVPDQSYYSTTPALHITGKSKEETVCPTDYVMLGGIAVIPVSDTIVLYAPPGGPDTVSITTDKMLSRHGIVVKNDTSVTIVPTSIVITNPIQNAYFYTPFYETQVLYDSLLPGQVTDPAQVLTFHDIDTGTFDIDLTLNFHYPEAIQKREITAQPTYQYQVVVHRVPTGSASVSPARSSIADFSLMPNPSGGDVTISLPSDMSSTIEIYDVLGNLVTRKEANGPFVWNGESEAGNRVPGGAYIVRVRTANSSGGTLASKRLMLMR